MDYQIEKYKSEFKDAILKVWERAVIATHHFLRADDFVEIKGMLQQFDFSELNVFCLMKDDEVIGFIGLHEKKIEMLFLDPDYIGKGLGKQLMNFAMMNFNADEVDVNEGNDAAKTFYERCGFNVFGRTEKDDAGRDYPILKMKRM
jgi:putative acetyltransferase